MSVATMSYQRPLRGSRVSSFYPQAPPEGPSLASFDSAFQLQEYLSVLVRQNPHDVERIVSVPGRARSGEKDGHDEGLERDGKETVVDEACWIYEQLRRLAQDLTHPLITSLQQECNRTTCPEMKAGEWLYLCVAHGNDGAMEQCCAIDYIIHTLDSATALLNSPRAFPSRITIPPASLRHFSSLARRLGRIFAHAYFHHRAIFVAAEAESALYARFLALTSRFSLVPAEFLVIPTRAIGSHGLDLDEKDGEEDVPRLLGAAVDPLRLQQRPARLGPDPSQVTGESNTPQNTESQRLWSPDKSTSPLSIVSANPVQLDSPRKHGRNRTDTMIFSEAAAFSEELRNNGAPTAVSAAESPIVDITAHDTVPANETAEEPIAAATTSDSLLIHDFREPVESQKTEGGETSDRQEAAESGELTSPSVTNSDGLSNLDEAASTKGTVELHPEVEEVPSPILVDEGESHSEVSLTPENLSKSDSSDGTGFVVIGSSGEMCNFDSADGCDESDLGQPSTEENPPTGPEIEGERETSPDLDETSPVEDNASYAADEADPFRDPESPEVTSEVIDESTLELAVEETPIEEEKEEEAIDPNMTLEVDLQDVENLL